MGVFDTGVSRWSLTEVRVTASLHKSQWLFSVLWPILIMQLSRWSLYVLLLQSLPVLGLILWGLCQVHKTQLVSPSTSSFMVLLCSLARSRYLPLFSLSFIFTRFAGTAKSTIRQVLFFFCWLSRGLVVWPRLGNIIIIILLTSISHQCLLMVFQWCLSDSKSPQVSWNLSGILADLNNAVVWMVLILSWFLIPPVRFPRLWELFQTC